MRMFAADEHSAEHWPRRASTGTLFAMTERRRPVGGRPRVSIWPGLRTEADQGATFVELFFDLVFVYAVTQVVGLVHDDPSGAGVARGLLAFWLVWWAWTQFTWTLNSADTRHRAVEAGTLVATTGAFFMAYALPRAFEDGEGLWFVVPYIAVRLVGLGLYLAVSDADPAQRSAVVQFSTLSVVGLALALVGGAVEDPVRSWLWLAVIVADLVAGGVAGGSTAWGLRPGHFAERHGLFVIIALGESLIAVGLTAAEVTRTGELVVVIVLGVAITGLLWWTYFAWIHPTLEHRVSSETGRTQSMMARDAFSFVHFVLVFGIVGLAVGLEAAVAHPGDAIAPAELTLLVGGTVAFLLATAVALWRTTREVLVGRVVVALALVAVCVLAASLPAPWMLAIVTASLATVVVAELRRQPPSDARQGDDGDSGAAMRPAG